MGEGAVGRRGGGDLEFVDARELAEALYVLSERGGDTSVLAGGTDVMVQYLRGDIAPRALLHVRRIPELHGLTSANGRTHIGAATTHRLLMTDGVVRRRHPALVDAAQTVGGRQTQNVGTIAGNVANASPAADLVPPLLVADAYVALTSARGNRSIGLAEFVVGRRRTSREPDELITSISLEPLRERSAEAYVKLGRRRAMEVAVVGLAARFTLAADQTVADARLAVCAVAPVAFRVADAEKTLIGACPDDPEALAEASEHLVRAAAPIDDARATSAYRTSVLAPLLRRALAICRDRLAV